MTKYEIFEGKNLCLIYKIEFSAVGISLLFKKFASMKWSDYKIALFRFIRFIAI